MMLRDPALLAILIMAGVARSQSWTEQVIPMPPEAGAGSLFGWSVALQDDLLLVGAPGCDVDATGGGAGFLFKRDQGGTGQWDLFLRLQTSSLSNGAAFGSQVLFRDDRIFIGAPGDQVDGISCGSIHVFQRDQGGPDNWGPLFRLGAPFPHNGEGFGSDFSIHDRLVVNMPEFDAQPETGANSPGGFALYSFGPDSVPELRSITIVSSLSSSGPACTFNGYCLFTQHIVQLDGLDPEGIPTPNYPIAGDLLPLHGWSARATSQDRLALTLNSFGERSHVVVLEAVDDTIGEAAHYWHDTVMYSETQRFGYALDWHEDRLAVGAPGAVQGPPLGRVHVVVQDIVNNEDWVDIDSFVPSDPEFGALFGHSIDLGNGLLAVGAPGQGPDDRGRVYLFHDPLATIPDGNDQLGFTRVWPQPAADRVEISLPTSTTLPVTATIADLTGARLRSFIVRDHGLQLDTRDLKPGCYLLLLGSPNNDARRLTARIMIARP